jgi:predicted nucleic acid-binding protein
VTDLVLDASVAAIAVAESGPKGDAARARLAGTVLHAPHLVDAEVGSVLRRTAAAKLITSDQAARSLRMLAHLVSERYPHGPLTRQAWALRHNVSFYDALYVALAARLGVPLLTADVRLAHAPELPCAIEILR